MSREESTEAYPWKDVRGDYVLVPVPPWERRTIMNIFLVYTGVLSCIAVLWVGGGLATQGGLMNVIYAAVIGCIIEAIIGALCAYVGGSTKQSTYGILRHVYGWYGSWLFGVLLSGIPNWGWFVYQSWFFGVMIHDLAPGNPLADVPIAALWGGLLMTVTAYIGYAGLAFLSYIVVPAYFILVTAGCFAGVHFGGGFEKLFEFTPQTPVPLTILITQVVGSYICGAIISSDIGRFARKPWHPSLAWAVQLVVLNVYYLVAAAMLTIGMGGTYFSKAMLMAGLGLGAYFVAIFGQWTTNDNNLYSSALSWNMFIPVKKRTLVLILGVAGAIYAWYTGITAYTSLEPFVNFLSMLGTWLPPIGGVLIADFYVFQAYKGVPRHERYKMAIGKEIPLVNWVAWLSMFIGGACAQGWLMPASVLAVIPPAIVGILMSFIVYIILAIALDKAGVSMYIGKAKLNEYGLPVKEVSA